MSEGEASAGASSLKWPGVNFSDVIHCRVHRPSLVLIEQDSLVLPPARNVYCYSPIMHRLQISEAAKAVQYTVEFSLLSGAGYRVNSKTNGDRQRPPLPTRRTEDEDGFATCRNGDDEMALCFQHPDAKASPAFGLIAHNASLVMVGVAV